MEKIENIVGFVALIDVLGFRELVGRDDDLSHVRQYIDTVVSLLENGQSPRPLQFVLFSDNLIVNTRDDTADSFQGLVVACSQLSFQLAQQRIAVRGAIAHGPFVRSSTTHQGVILAGRPIVEANHYQHAQNWVGSILAPSVIRRDAGLNQRCKIIQPESEETRAKWADRLPLAVHLQRYAGIPFHAASPFDKDFFDGYVVVPMRPGVSSPKTITASLEEMECQLEIMKASAPDPASQAKYSESLRWLWTVKSSWR